MRLEVSVKSKLMCAASAAIVLALSSSPVSADLDSATKAYGKLLAQYVTPRGVKYDAWRTSGADIKKLSEVLMIFRSTDPHTLTADERKALYINLYNAKILDLVLVANPRGSIRELSKGLNPSEIFSRDGISFDDKMISLNDLEKRLHDEFKDPRVHFALNCASKSCPPIRKEAYVAGSLDGQLDEATRDYLASPGAVEVLSGGGKTTIVASKIFDWYAPDFKASGGPLAFLQKFGPRDASEAIAAGKAKLSFADYDWSLNAAK
jgi:hypothetical protein